MRLRIHVIIPAHLCMSPRGQREALALQQAGHEVTMSGVWFDARQAELDVQLRRRLQLQFTPALDLRPRRAPAARCIKRAKGRWARARFGWSRHFSPALLGHGIAEQWAEARRLNADLTIVHSEAGLWIGEQLLREGRMVGVDFEDWFSRDLPAAARTHRPVAELTRLEKTLLQHATYRLASSRVMAHALARAYEVSSPAVVTNAGQPRSSGMLRNAKDPLRLHWFSQTIGPARGLELLFAALPLVHHNVRVELRGSCTPEHRSWLQRLIPSRCQERVTVSKPVPPWELAARIAEHDVGLALETESIASRNLCISNKSFHYLASGLAVIATATEGHRELLSPCAQAGFLFDESSPRKLAEIIDRLALDRELLRSTQAAAHRAAHGAWSGAHERSTIVREAERALGADWSPRDDGQRRSASQLR